MTQPEHGPENSPANEEAIAASNRFAEWMGLLQADHAQYLEDAPNGGTILVMDNAHLRLLEPGLPPTRAIIRSISPASRPYLELTVHEDKHTSWVTSVVHAKKIDQYYTLAGSKQVRTTFSTTETEVVYAPHPVTDLEVNKILNDIAPLRPPQSMEVPKIHTHQSGLAGFIGRLVGRG